MGISTGSVCAPSIALAVADATHDIASLSVEAIVSSILHVVLCLGRIECRQMYRATTS